MQASPSEISLSPAAPAPRAEAILGVPFQAAILAIGIAALVLPTLFTLADEYWSTDNGAHGPIILVTGLWLLWRERESIRLRPRSVPSVFLAGALPPLLLLYVYGRAFEIPTVESASLYGALLVLGLFYWGPETMRRLWFAVLYLGFLIKPPSGWVAELTQPLKVWISEAAVAILQLFDLPVAHSGVRIQIAQYELLVQQACAGLGSIFSLLAIGLLYIHLTGHRSRVHTALLIIGIVPVAILANLLRVILLVLLTYYAGNDVAQSFAHDLTGLVTFALSMLGMLVLDWALGLSRARRT
jgi:exosortase